MANDNFGATIPAEIALKLSDILPEFGDLNHEELLQHQKCVLESLKGYMNWDKAPNDGHVSTLGQFSVGESSRPVSFNQTELDEAFARSLQMEDEFDDVDASHVHESHSRTSLSSHSSNSYNSATSRDVEGVTSRETHTHSSHDAVHDDVDPDNMSYEQLQSLGEAVGSESRGLPEKVIASLRIFKYKTGVFFRKKEKQECVICYMPFENGDKLICLSCSHQYHSKCIKCWLRVKKNCPVCLTEVSQD